MISDPGPNIMFTMWRFVEKLRLVDIQDWRRTEPLGVVGIDSVVYRYCAKYALHRGEGEDV